MYHERGIPEEMGEFPECEEEDEVYEIDCGRSNVEVRCIRERAPSRAMTTRSALPGNQGMARWGQERHLAADPFAMRYVTLKDVEGGYHGRELQTPQPHHYGYNHQLLGNSQQGFNPYGTWSRQPSFRNYPTNTVQVDHRRNRAASQLAAPQAYLGPQMHGYLGNQHLRPASPHQDHPTRGMTSSMSLQFRSNPQLSPSKQPNVTSLMNKSKSGDDLLSGENPNQKDVEQSSEGSSEGRKNLSKNSGELRLFKTFFVVAGRFCMVLFFKLQQLKVHNYFLFSVNFVL